MSRAEKAVAVLTIRIDTDLSRSLAREARRQSLLVSRRRLEKEALEFIEQTADTRGWT